jgi:adenosine deaminase
VCCAGVFGTTLSQEYALAASAFNLSQDQLFDLAERAVQHCFCSEQDKQLLLKHFDNFKQQRRQQHPTHTS